MRQHKITSHFKHQKKRKRRRKPTTNQGKKITKIHLKNNMRATKFFNQKGIKELK